MSHSDGGIPPGQDPATWSPFQDPQGLSQASYSYFSSGAPLIALARVPPVGHWGKIVPLAHPPSFQEIMDRTCVRVLKRQPGRPDSPPSAETPSARLGMMWDLTMTAWTFAGRLPDGESRLQRRLVRVHRR